MIEHLPGAALGIGVTVATQLIFSTKGSKIAAANLGFCIVLAPQIAKSLKGRVNIDLRVSCFFALASAIITVAINLLRTKQEPPQITPPAMERPPPRGQEHPEPVSEPVPEPIMGQGQTPSGVGESQEPSPSAQQEELMPVAPPQPEPSGPVQPASNPSSIAARVEAGVAVVLYPVGFCLDAVVYGVDTANSHLLAGLHRVADRIAPVVDVVREGVQDYLAAVERTDVEQANRFVAEELAPALKRLGVLPMFLSAYDALLHPQSRCEEFAVGVVHSSITRQFAPKYTASNRVRVMGNSDLRIRALNELCNKHWRWVEAPAKMGQPSILSMMQAGVLQVRTFKERTAKAITTRLAAPGLSSEQAEREVDRFIQALQANAENASRQVSCHPAIAHALPAILRFFTAHFRPDMILLIQQANLAINQQYVQSLFVNSFLDGFAKALIPGYELGRNIHQDCVRLYCLQYIHEHVNAVLALKTALWVGARFTFNQILACIEGSEIDKALDTLFNPITKGRVLAAMGGAQIALCVKNADEHSPPFIQYCQATAWDIWDQPSSEGMVRLQGAFLSGISAGRAASSGAKTEERLLEGALAETEIAQISRHNIGLAVAPEVVNIVARFAYTFAGNPASVSSIAKNAAVGAGKVALGVGLGPAVAKGLSAGAAAASLDDLATRFWVTLFTGVSTTYEELTTRTYEQKQLQD